MTQVTTTISDLKEDNSQKVIPFRCPFLNKIAQRISNFISSGTRTGWVKGSINGYQYYVKAYEKPSKIGLNGSVISKLELWKNEVLVVNYDRGWDKRPNNKELENIVNTILKIMK